MVRHGHDNDAQKSAFEAEHWLAWLFSGGALLLALLGLLRACGWFGPANTTAAGQVTSISPGGLPDTLWDGGMLLLAAMSSALLAWAFHRNDHHRMRDLDTVPDREEGLWKVEHLLAYVLAVATVLFTVIGLLTGYNKMGAHHWQPEGIPWLLMGLTTGFLTNVLHSVRHHQLAWEPGHVQTSRERLATTPAHDAFIQEPTSGYRPEGPRPADPMHPTQPLPPVQRRQ
jgi:hypothetical protein